MEHFLGLLEGLAKLRILKLNNLTPAPTVLESQTWFVLFKSPHFSERHPHLFSGPSRPQRPVSHPQYPRPADCHLLSRMSPFFISSTPLSISEPSPPPSWKLQEFSNWPTCIYPAQVPSSQSLAVVFRAKPRLHFSRLRSKSALLTTAHSLHSSPLTVFWSRTLSLSRCSRGFCTLRRPCHVPSSLPSPHPLKPDVPFLSNFSLLPQLHQTDS